MSTAVALLLYPPWAVAMLVGLTALRLGRGTGRGLVALCFALAVWITGIVLFQHPGTRRLAEHILPSGIFIGAALIHAGVEAAAPARRQLALAGWLFASGVSGLGVLAPELLYRRGLAAAGPLFWPLAVVSAAATTATVAGLTRAGLSRRGRERQRLFALALASLAAALGGGLAVLAQIHGVLALPWAAPPLVVAVGLASWAVLGAQLGASRRLVGQGLGYAALTASFSAVGLVVFFRLLPELAPGRGASFLWLVVVTFFAALPLDGLRMLLVDELGRRLFPRPIGVRDLADEAGRSEARADHAERLAAIGTLASAVAHEIRNPLGIIAAQAKLLERRGADPEQVADLRAQVERARQFIDDLLRYGKPRPLELGVVDVARALPAALASVLAGVETPPPIEIDAAPGEIEADPAAFHDVLVVLIANAVAALHGRADARLRLRARGEAEQVLITVEDNGAGVPEAIEARLFEPFVSGRGRDSVYPGTGLGLAIAAGHASRHGGTIRHQRPAAGGARFVVTWPRRSAAHA